MKIWLDDLRKAPQGFVHCYSVNQAKQAILAGESQNETIEIIDCDHDLGDYYPDGGDGIKLLDWLAERETYYPVALHTQNPVGRDNMLRLVNAYWK